MNDATVNKLQYPRAWLSFGVTMLIVLIILSMITIDQRMIPIPYLDKIEHFSAWLVMMFWFTSLYPRYGLIILGILLTISLGVELVQALISWRQGSADDLLANFLGLLVGWAMAIANKGLLLKFLDTKLVRVLRE